MLSAVQAKIHDFLNFKFQKGLKLWVCWHKPSASGVLGQEITLISRETGKEVVGRGSHLGVPPSTGKRYSCRRFENERLRGLS